MTKDDFIEKMRYFTSDSFLDEIKKVADKSGSLDSAFFADSVALNCIRRMFSEMED